MSGGCCTGKLLYKGAFTVGDPSGKWQLPTDISVRQPANTGVVDWAQRILALYERDLPYELDGALRTLGTTKLGAWKGVLHAP
jgi:all-trans-8'-apo-beta-carotenal 15,15'-oxygenase